MGKASAFGATLTWDSASVAGLNSIQPAGMTLDMVDVSNHLSTSAFKEYVPGMLDAGEVRIEGFWDYSDANGQQAMQADMVSRTAKEMIITFPSATGTVLTANAFCIAYNPGNLMADGAVGFSATLKITGVPVWTFAASAGLTTPFFAISESAVVTPDEAADVYDYVATVLTGVTSVTVTPTATAGVITVNGNVVASGQASSAIPLGAAGSVTVITIVATETGKSPKTYTVRVARAAS